MAIPSTTLTLSPQLNALAVVAQSAHDNLVAMEKTKKAFLEEMGEKEKTLQEQAARIALLEAQVAQWEAIDQKRNVVEQALQGRVNQLIGEKSELLDKIAYQQRGIDALNLELADHKNRRSEYYDIIGGLRGWRGHSRDAALHKCRTYGF